MLSFIIVFPLKNPRGHSQRYHILLSRWMLERALLHVLSNRNLCEKDSCEQLLYSYAIKHKGCPFLCWQCPSLHTWTDPLAGRRDLGNSYPFCPQLQFSEALTTRHHWPKELCKTAQRMFSSVNNKLCHSHSTATASLMLSWPWKYFHIQHIKTNEQKRKKTRIIGRAACSAVKSESSQHNATQYHTWNHAVQNNLLNSKSVRMYVCVCTCSVRCQCAHSPPLSMFSVTACEDPAQYLSYCAHDD